MRLSKAALLAAADACETFPSKYIMYWALTLDGEPILNSVLEYELQGGVQVIG